MTDAEGAEELSKAIGTATFEGRTESRSGTIAENRIVTANTQWQAGEPLGLVRERLVTPDELITLGPDRQYVIGAPKDMPRDALHLHHARYWRRPDAEFHADPNPFVIRTERAADPTLTEIPPGRRQIEYKGSSDQWVPRGQVLRCHIEDDEEEKPVIHVDDLELDLEAFGRMLLTFCGFGMRIAFVDEEDVNDEPEIVVREPEEKEVR